MPMTPQLPIISGLAVVAALGLGSPAATGDADGLRLADDPRIDPSAFRVTEFAADLPYAAGMQMLSDRSLLVGVSDPTGGRFHRSTGKLLRLTDTDQDGVADDAGTYLHEDLPGGIVQMRLVGDLLVVNSQQARRASISFLRAGESVESAFELLGSIDFGFPEDHLHDTYALATRPGSDATSFELFFNVGGGNNAVNDSTPIPVTGLLEGELTPESLYRVRVAFDGEDVTIADPHLIAIGLRNAAGAAFHPANHDLYFEDNGFDVEDETDEPVSADELNMIPAAELGSSVPDFGFAHTYVAYRTGELVGDTGVQPIVAFQPIDGSEAQGPAEISFAPPRFPSGLNDGIFVTFHGRYSLGGLENEENPLMFVDPGTATYFEFIPNDVASIGHLDSVLATDDSLFLSDINRDGDMGSDTPRGAIYQIKAMP
jgi:glucose/arabinose dehydrogenase